MIVTFATVATRDVFEGRITRRARRACPPSLWNVARRKPDQLDSAEALEDLAAPPGNRLEALRGERAGQHSIRINRQLRICFTWTPAGPRGVEIADYH
jgi:proteic killer suppression protein